MWLPARLLVLGAPPLLLLVHAPPCLAAVESCVEAVHDNSPPGKVAWAGWLPRPFPCPILMTGFTASSLAFCLILAAVVDEI